MFPAETPVLLLISPICWFKSNTQLLLVGAPLFGGEIHICWNRNIPILWLKCLVCGGFILVYSWFFLSPSVIRILPQPNLLDTLGRLWRPRDSWLRMWQDVDRRVWKWITYGQICDGSRTGVWLFSDGAGKKISNHQIRSDDYRPHMSLKQASYVNLSKFGKKLAISNPAVEFKLSMPLVGAVMDGFVWTNRIADTLMLTQDIRQGQNGSKFTPQNRVHADRPKRNVHLEQPVGWNKYQSKSVILARVDIANRRASNEERHFQHLNRSNVGMDVPSISRF